MKNLILMLCLTFVTGISATAQKTSQKQTTNNVKVYYFHMTHRCATCQAVESVTKDALHEYYNDKVFFESINIEKENDNPLLKKYKVSGQTLLIIKGDKVIDITNQAFMNARTNPDKLKSEIKTTVDNLI